MTDVMQTTETRRHWEGVWTSKQPEEVSWFESRPRVSLEMIEAVGLPLDAPILDVGGGASRLAAELVDRGYEDVTVADISEAALAEAREALGRDAERVNWVVADVTGHDFGRRFALWHDRAVFHFLIDEADRRRYLEVLQRSLAPGGHVLIATFGPDGPTSCSGLPVVRYGAEELAAMFAPVAKLVEHRLEVHRTPSGKDQQFLHAGLEAG
jgi:SAM-dependent methyltransferase